MTKLLLASRSPRRRELLSQVGVPFETVRVGVSEALEAGEPAEHYVERVARDKADAGLAAQDRRGLPVLGADTAVVLDGEVFGKPRDGDDAAAMLRRLSGRCHQVMSAVAVAMGQDMHSRLQVSTVRFAELDERAIAAYWRSGEPADKAGAYAIQGLGAAFVEHLEGSYSGVMGLPLFETLALLGKLGIVRLDEQLAGGTTLELDA